VIQGFSLESQRAIGMIRLELMMGDLSTSSIFHVIDSKTLYKLLLGRPWLHEHGIVASTLHQCLKYYRGGERKINGDVQPFTRAESYFADAKFFEEDSVPKEMMISIICSIGKGEPKATRNSQMAIGHDGIKQQQGERDDKQVREIQSIKQVARQMAASTNSMIPVLRYILKSRRKKGESPFGRVVNGEAESKITRNADEASLGALKGSVTFSTQKVY